MKLNSYRVLVGLFVILLMSSCASRKEVVYFQDTGKYETLIDENKSITKFKVDDLVSIYVSSLNPEASTPFNLFRGASEGGLRAEQVDYLVDQEGMIDFPVIGKLKIEGLSPDELRILLRSRLSEYLKDPIINIRSTKFYGDDFRAGIPSWDLSCQWGTDHHSGSIGTCR